VIVRSCLVILAILAPVSVPAAEAPWREIRPAAIREHLEILASDAFGGRAPGTEGGAKTEAYLVEQLRAAGVEPAFSDGYRQSIPLHATRSTAGSYAVFWRGAVRRPLAIGEEAILLSWPPAVRLPKPAWLVFVGYGITAPEFDHDDYADVSVAGRVAVVLAGEPESDDPDWFGGPAATIYSTVESKRRMAMAQGAVATIVLPSVAPGGIGHGWRDLARETSTERYQLAWGIPDHLSMVMHPDMASWLFRDALYDLETIQDLGARGAWQSFYLPVALTFEGRFANRDVLASNIVGVIPGRDPALADRWVVVTAHWDHLGTAPDDAAAFAPGDDRVFNGAVDNAIGVAGVLELARVLAAGDRAPRRSVLVVLTTGEESGLLGAQYFVEHPPVPLARMVAAVNVDGLATAGPVDGVIAVGGELSDLGWRLERAVRPLDMAPGEAPPELRMSEGFARSDQWAFAHAGVPAVMVNESFPEDPVERIRAVERATRWLVERYHTPFDDLSQEVDFEAAARHLAAITAFVVALADSPTEPVWRPNVPYAYVRAVSRAETP
jgi:hypothetical protein